jgi:Tfp pilus assembly protein PilO
MPEGLQEIINRYRNLPMWVRLLTAALVGFVPAFMIYTEDAATVEEMLMQAKNDEDAAKTKLAEARKITKNIDAVQKKKDFTEEQLKKARLEVPDTIHIDKILRRSATLAREFQVELQSFAPIGEKMITGDVSYKEVRIKVELVGRYNDIGSYLDRISNAEEKIFVRNLEFGSYEPKSEASPTLKTADQNLESKEALAYAEAVQKREKVKVLAAVNFVMYRMPTSAELSAELAPPAEAPRGAGRVPPPTPPKT